MLTDEYRRMYENEDRYWWYVSRRELVVDLARKIGLSPSARLIDVGCGTGAIASALGDVCQAAGVDFSTEALRFCRDRGLAGLVRGSAERLPLRDETLDAIVATDILEHLDDDVAALKEFRRALKPGGCAIITVPAYQFLWGEHDEALMHKRRYVPKLLADRARAAGFEVEWISFSLCFLFPMALTRLLKRRAPGDRPPQAQIVPVPHWLNQALIRFQRWETRLLRFLRLPWGLTVAAILRKPQSEGDQKERERQERVADN